VVVADVNAEGAAATAAALSKEGITAVSCGGDVGDKASADAMVASAVSAFGGLDVLVANAGIVKACDFLDMSE
jgi:NAD(P)-dependent dehydrogenase (short-subunit alcohol dehydrogenase family)